MGCTGKLSFANILGLCYNTLKGGGGHHDTEKQLAPSQDALHLCEQVSDGRISADAAVETLLRLYDRKRADAKD